MFNTVVSKTDFAMWCRRVKNWWQEEVGEGKGLRSVVLCSKEEISATPHRGTRYQA